MGQDRALKILPGSRVEGAQGGQPRVAGMAEHPVREDGKNLLIAPSAGPPLQPMGRSASGWVGQVEGRKGCRAGMAKAEVDRLPERRDRHPVRPEQTEEFTGIRRVYPLAGGQSPGISA